MVRYFALGAVAIFFSLKAFGGAIPLPGPLTGTICLVLFSALFVLYRPGRLHHALPLPKWFKFAFLALIVAAIWVRVQAIREFPMDVLRADMLFTIESQIRDFLSGADPYTATTFSTGGSVARTYLPGLWLSYLPLHVLGLDLRYLNLAAHLLFYCLLFRCFQRRGMRDRREWLFFLALVALHVFSKQAVKEVRDLQTGPLWIYFSLLVWALMEEKHGLALVLSPLVLFSRHPAVLLFLPWTGFALRNARRDLLLCSTTTLVAAAVFIFGFMKGIGALLNGSKVYADFYATLSADEMLKYFGPAGYFQQWGIIGLVKYLQIGAALGAIAIGWNTKHATPLQLLAQGMIGYLFFIWLTPTAFSYLFAEAILLSFFLLFSSESARTQNRTGTGLPPRDFKSLASTNSAMRAILETLRNPENNRGIQLL